MIRAEYREALESQHKILVVLWGVFIGGISLYLWIAKVFLAERQLTMAGSFSQTARFVLWLLAILDVATLMWWKRRFLIREALLFGAKQYKILQALQGHKTPLEERAAKAVSSYVTSKIVAFAMAEAVAIYGFAMVLTSRYFLGQYILSGAAAALLLLEFPSRAFLMKLLQELEAEGGSPAAEKTAVS
jgi:hypothetical protein